MAKPNIKTLEESLWKAADKLRANGGVSVTNQESMDELLQFMNHLTDDQQWTSREEQTKQELKLYDMLLKPKLTKAQKQKAKFAVKDLLQRLRENQSSLFPLRWNQSTQKKQAQYSFINDSLNVTLPQSYGRQDFSERKDKIYTFLLMRDDEATLLFAG